MVIQFPVLVLIRSQDRVVPVGPAVDSEPEPFGPALWLCFAESYFCGSGPTRFDSSGSVQEAVSKENHQLVLEQRTGPHQVR